MRRFAFRAWNNKTKQWQHKDACDLFGEMILLGGWMEGVRLQDLNDITVMQFTGIRDKNGKEIYEGDIAKLKHCTALYICTWAPEAACFYWACAVTNDYSSMHYESEVVGNIFDNPELIGRLYGAARNNKRMD